LGGNRLVNGGVGMGMLMGGLEECKGHDHGQG
jgi:hypothetical protein